MHGFLWDFVFFSCSPISCARKSHFYGAKENKLWSHGAQVQLPALPLRFTCMGLQASYFTFMPQFSDPVSGLIIIAPTSENCGNCQLLQVTPVEKYWERGTYDL